MESLVLTPPSLLPPKNVVNMYKLIQVKVNSLLEGQVKGKQRERETNKPHNQEI